MIINYFWGKVGVLMSGLSVAAVLLDSLDAVRGAEKHSRGWDCNALAELLSRWQSVTLSVIFEQRFLHKQYSQLAYHQPHSVIHLPLSTHSPISSHAPSPTMLCPVSPFLSLHSIPSLTS